PQCTGGGLMSESNVYLTDTLIIRNTSQGHGGGVSANAITMLHGLVEENGCQESTCLGGGLSADNLTLTSTQVLSNGSVLDGGGAFARGLGRLSAARFQGNYCSSINCRGGGVFAESSVVVADTAFINNISPFNGAGIYAQGALTATRSLFQ